MRRCLPAWVLARWNPPTRRCASAIKSEAHSRFSRLHAKSVRARVQIIWREFPLGPLVSGSTERGQHQHRPHRRFAAPVCASGGRPVRLFSGSVGESGKLRQSGAVRFACAYCGGLRGHSIGPVRERLKTLEAGRLRPLLNSLTLVRTVLAVLAPVGIPYAQSPVQSGIPGCH